MSRVIAFLRQLIDAGMPLDMAMMAAEKFEEAPPVFEVSSGARRTRRWREKQEQSAGEGVTERHEASPTVTDVTHVTGPFLSPPPSPRPLSSTTNLSQLPPLSPKKPARKASLAAAFEAFWAVYPRKVGKGAAERAFPKALALADLETLTTAARAYAAKVAEVEVGLIKHPSGWLNDKRWLDTYDPPSGGSATIFDADALAKRRAQNARLYEEIR
jgi:hypothetical protein